MKQKYSRGLVAVGCGIAASFGAAAMVVGCTGDDVANESVAKVDSDTPHIDSGTKANASTTNRATAIHTTSGAPACPSAQVLCSGACSTLSHDPQNCGACGVTCGAGEACSAGECTTTCGGEQSLCSAGDAGDAGSAYCATFASDNANCGSCGHQCGAGEMCSNGQCNVTCGAGGMLCSADGGASNGIDGGPAFCADFATENDNCGGCGIACGAGQVCNNGTCGTTCEGDLVQCGNKCIDPTSSMTNCGATAACDADAGTAGTACDANTEACSAGACAALKPVPKFIASFNVEDGPSFWPDSPPSYSCVQACALINGGDPSDYGCSTVPDSLNHLAWGSMWGSGEHCATSDVNDDGPGTPVADTYTQGDGTYHCVDGNCAPFSAYVADHCYQGDSINYCWRVPPTDPQ